MKPRKRVSFLKLCKETASRCIDDAIAVILERRCSVCTTPFQPLPQTPSLTSAANPGASSSTSSGAFSAAKPAVRTLSASSHDEAFASRFFCASCARKLPRLISGHCPLCGELSPWPLAPNALCLSCLKRRPPWESLTFHAPYEGLLRKMILRHKFSNMLSLGHVLGQLLAQHPTLAAIHFDAIVPVPLHAQRLRQRGYNQAMEIAKGLLASRKHHAVILPHALRRTQPTRPQVGLSHTERLHNVRGAFKVTRSLKKRHILLIDDVYTTGSTLWECATELHKAHAASVHVATLARTRRRHVFS